MANLNDINTEYLIKYISKTRLDTEEIDKILKDDDLEYAEYEKAFFLMLCYDKYSVIQPMKKGWMKRTVDVYQDNPEREKGEILELWDESDYRNFAKSLENLLELGVDENDLYRIIKETQKNVLAHVMEGLDGVFGSEFGLFETKLQDGENIPKRRIMGLSDVFLDYDPRTE